MAIIVDSSGYVAVGEAFASSSEMRATDIVVGDCELLAGWHGIIFGCPWFHVRAERDGRGSLGLYFRARGDA
jgi:hypothetical protein